MKRKLLLLLAALLPMAASAYDAKIDGICYNLSKKLKQAKVTTGGNYTGTVNIPESVTYEDVVYSVTSIDDSAFKGYSTMTSISIPNSVTSIGSYAFYGCTRLTSVTIPISVTKIGERVFYDCSSLTSITIPESVTWIGEAAFYGCRCLTSITIPNSVTSIDKYAFYNCSSLKSVTIGNSVKSIDNYTFYNCSSLKSITIPNSVTRIGYDAFNGCSGLTTITIPSSVSYIGERAFWAGNRLKLVTINSNAILSPGRSSMSTIFGNQVTQYVIGNSVKAIGEYIFSNCSSMTSLTIGNSVTNIGQGAFRGCSGLTSVTIPNSVTYIGSEAFQNCSSLTSVYIPNSVTSIEYFAFAYCQELTDVYCYAENVPSTNAVAFYNSYIEYATLHVPASAIEQYWSTAPWSQFGTIKTTDGTIPDPPTPEKCATPTISYANGELTFDSETEGVDFISEIKDTDIKKYYSKSVSLTATYTITVYATKEGYENSEVATATLCWIDVEPQTEGLTDEDAVAEVKALPVLIQTQGGTITVQGATEGTNVSVYSVNGMLQGSAIADKGIAILNTSLQPGSFAIVKIGEKSIKVLVK